MDFSVIYGKYNLITVSINDIYCNNKDCEHPIFFPNFFDDNYQHDKKENKYPEQDNHARSFTLSNEISDYSRITKIKNQTVYTNKNIEYNNYLPNF